jgi:hypothetical protein
MDAQRLYETWAPPDSVWSPWAKPVLFAAFESTPAPAWQAEVGPVHEAGHERTRPDVYLDPEAACIVDLPGSASVEMGLVLAREGWRPVPLYNTSQHAAAVVKVEPILSRLAGGAAELAAFGLPPQAPPAFLLDSGRYGPADAPRPGSFDNRWVVFPQDFPSASFLRARGIRRVLVVQEPRPGPIGEIVLNRPDSDLAHVLLRFREGGLELYWTTPDFAGGPRPLTVDKPSSFRSLFYRALVLAGLRRNSAGGFGGTIPQASSGSGFS